MNDDTDLYLFLPKTDLHLHLDGAVRPETFREMAEASGRTRAQIDSHLRVGQANSLSKYLSHFEFVLPLLQRPEILSRVAYEIVEDASYQSAAYVEIRFCPLLHCSEGLDTEAVVAAVLAGAIAAHEDLGAILPRFILSVQWGMDGTMAETLVNAAIKFNSEGVVGIDLAGDESRGFDLDPFVPAFERAHAAGLKITCHAGEAGPAANISQAILRLHASRIGHGTSIMADPRTVELAIERNVGIECCLTSNVQTGAVPSLLAHPFKAMLDAGLCVTINTDNPTFSDTDIMQEWRRVIEVIGLNANECSQVLANGFAQMFLEDATPP